MSNALTRSYAPIAHILHAPETEDFAMQEPGVGWWLHHGKWHRTEVPEMTYARQMGISVLAAAQTRQVISHAKPILSCDLPGLLRLQAIMPPVQSPGTMSITIRQGDRDIDEVEAVPAMYNTARWNKWAGRKERRRAIIAPLLDCFDSGDIVAFLSMAARSRQTGLFCGPTGAGKSRLSKLLGGAIPVDERIIAIEDAAELVIRQPNHVRHFYSADEATGVRPARLMKSAMRERPDRVILGELRDPEGAAVFVSVIAAGHPGSMSTIHGTNPEEAARRLVDMISDGKSDNAMAIGQLETAIDFIIPVENDGGVRAIGEIWFRPDAERRGESFRDLLSGGK
jgi:type IV secretion system protein VirB11